MRTFAERKATLEVNEDRARATHACLISFGANLGNPVASILAAAKQIESRLSACSNGFRLSRLFKTPAVGGPVGQPDFVNAVAALETCCDPWTVWKCIRDVESSLGRQRNQRWEARQIDLDILLYDRCRLWTPDLKIPHPRMCMRRFILQPSLDVAGSWHEPVTGWSIRRLADNLNASPARLMVVSSSLEFDCRLLRLAAHRSRAIFHDFCAGQRVHGRGLDGDRNAVPPAPVKSRWLGHIELSAICNMAPKWDAFSPSATIVLAGPVHRESVAWEDHHRSLAVSLGIAEPESEVRGEGLAAHWPIDGPRYLLAGDDPQWTVHEIAAAMDAMDCAVEPIS